MNFEGDAFISYAHLDNVGLIEGRKGWVASLHRALQIRVAQLLGKDARIWWDPKLQGNDYFTVTLSDRLQRVAALITILSPRYIKSDWGRKELEEFCRAAEQQGGLRIKDKARIFKVLKTPVPLDQHPPELQSLLGYEFFTADPETGRVRELDEVFGPEAQREFWLKLDDLAHDLCCLLQLLDPEDEPDSVPEGAETAVYLAFTTADLNDEREAIKRDLEQHGITVLPNRALPYAIADLQSAVRDDLTRCCMSIHMIGATFSFVPEGCERSLTDIQNDLAIERAAAGGLSRLIWIRPSLQVRDERQQQLIERLRSHARNPAGTDLIERPLEDLRTVIGAWLKKGAKPDAIVPVPVHTSSPQLYFLYDRRDAETIAPWADCLFKDFEIIYPTFEGDEAEIREYHEENLRNCDGSLIFYGAGNECWLRRKMREVQKSAGYGRTKPAPLVGICLIGEKTPEKERFRTHEAIVVPQWDGPRPEDLEAFVTRLKDCARPVDNDAVG